MKALVLPFHMMYGNMIYSKRLQSDRPKRWRMLVEAGATQKAKKYTKFNVVWSTLNQRNYNWLKFQTTNYVLQMENQTLVKKPCLLSVNPFQKKRMDSAGRERCNFEHN